MLNSGAAGATQIGKILTIYPANDDMAKSLAQQIDDLWSFPLGHGPEILSDKRLHSRSSVYVRFGAFRDAPVITDTLGRRHFALTAPDGSLIPDQRRVDGEQVPWAPPTFPELVQPGKHRSVYRISGTQYVSLAVLQDTPSHRVALVLDEDCITRVMKIAKCGVGGDFRGNDACSRTLREYNTLSYLYKLGVKCPRAIVLPTDHPVSFIMEDLNGTALSNLPYRQRIDCLPLLIKAVADLHSVGYVHRDLKLHNTILRDASVYLLDFELAAPIGDNTPPRGGTPGYTPPEGWDGIVSQATDIYALGACVCHAVLQIDPATLLPGGGRLVGLMNIYGLQPVASLVSQMMSPNQDARPSALQVLKLAHRNLDLFRSRAPAGHSMRRQNRRWRKIVEAGLGTDKFAVAAATVKSWRNTHIQSNFICEGISLGASGIILGLLTLDTCMKRTMFEKDVLLGVEWLKSQPMSRVAQGIFTGNAGIALAMGVVSRLHSRCDLLHSARERLSVAVNHVSETDLFSGQAGVVWSGCLLAEILNCEWPVNLVKKAAEDLMSGAREIERVLTWVATSGLDPGNEPYFGAALGSAGIAMALGTWGRISGSTAAESLARETFWTIYEHARTVDGHGLRRRVGSVASAHSGIWCHGAAGYLWSIIHAFGDSASLREPIDWAVDAFRNADPVPNPTYCHGLAGQLELWRMLCRIDQYERIAAEGAAFSADVIEQLGFRRNQNWLWPADDPGVVTPDLWLGFLGPASSLALYHTGLSNALLSSEWLGIVCNAK
jgi:serine/threonine protein kinase